ncbi:protein PIMREG [Thomomys bottae]
MASRRRSMKTSQRPSLLKEEQDVEATTPAALGPQGTGTGALGSLCRQFQRRLPLRTVSLNLGAGPSWKRLETPAPEQQGLQAAARSAKNALGAMSQRIQQSCQSGTKWLMETQVTARRRKRGAQKGRASPTPSLSQRSTRRYGASWGSQEREQPSPSTQVPPPHQRRRLRREAALRSPYSSAEPLFSPNESDNDLEPVGAGIQHLQKLSRKLHEVIMAAENDMSRPLICD